MTRAIALYTAARRRCKEQHSYWLNQYRTLQTTEGFRAEKHLRKGWTYSNNACGIFPRYRLADAILINLERLVPTEETSVPEVIQFTREAAEIAYSKLSDELGTIEHHKVALGALREQFEDFKAFLEARSLEGDLKIDSLPYRRVLAEDESADLWKQLNRCWGIRGPGYGWIPLTDDPLPAGLLTFHEDLWDARNGNGVLGSFFDQHDIARCFLVREMGPPDFQIDTVLASEPYDGSESFLFTDSHWVLYRSHESSLTLAGTIAEFFLRKWPDAHQLSYRGPFCTSDLRGSQSSS